MLVRLYIPLVNANVIANDIKTKINNDSWYFSKSTGGYIIENSKHLVDVLLDSEINQRKKIIDFFFDSIKSLKEIKSAFPQVFGKEL